MNDLRMPPFGQRSGTYCLETRMLVVFQFQFIGSMIQADIHWRDFVRLGPWGLGVV